MSLIKKLLVEIATDEIYHFTRISNLLRIVQEDKLKTSTVLGSTSDERHNKGKYFFFSTQRSGHGKIGYGIKGSSQVRLVMDGRRLSQRYKVKPVDYWMRSRQPAGIPDMRDSIKANMMMGDEMEDRVMLDAGEIPNASTYISRIDILFDPTDEREATAVQEIDKASEGKFEIYYFTEDQQSDWDNMRTDKATTDLLEIEDLAIDEEEREKVLDTSKYLRGFRSPILIAYLKLMDSDRVDEAKKLILQDKQLQDNYERYYKDKAPTVEQYLEDEIEDELSMSRLRNIAYPVFKQELVTSLKNIFHNNRSTNNPYMRKLIEIFSQEMKKKGLKDVEDVIDYVQPKAKELYDNK